MNTKNGTTKNCNTQQSLRNGLPKSRLLSGLLPGIDGKTTDRKETACARFKNKADVQEVKHGEWYVDSPFACSICDGLNDYKDDYCPHCGAKMDGDGKA